MTEQFLWITLGLAAAVSVAMVVLMEIGYRLQGGTSRSHSDSETIQLSPPQGRP